ncbi:MAG: hypothetical protein WAR75_02120, partial [Methanothrix sp.]
QGIGQGGRGTIPIIQPLRRIPAREVRLYALQHGLCFCRERGKREERQARAREELSLFDLRHPGTKYSLLRSLEKLGLRDLIDQGPPGAKPLSDDEK